MAGYTLEPLSPGASYWGPGDELDTRCMCNTITWGLFSACGICQNGTAISCVALLSLCCVSDCFSIGVDGICGHIIVRT